MLYNVAFDKDSENIVNNFWLKLQKYSGKSNTRLNSTRTSDSLIERLPIKMTREKFQRKQYFFHENDSRCYPQVIRKSVFLIGQVPIKKYGLKTLFLLFNT